MIKGCRRLQCSGFLALALLFAGASWGQLEINSSPNVVGSGARALGMGGAFIAVADDATAASWNPGGLTQLERPEVSFVYGLKWNEEDFTSETHPELDGSHSVNFSEINYISAVYPIRRTIAGRNLVLSLNYQRKFDFDRDLKLRFNARGALAGGALARTTNLVDYSQRGGLGAISPAFGFEISNKLSVGLVMNIWHQSLLPDNEWKERTTFRSRAFLNNTPLAFSRLRIEEDYDNFEGINYTAGVLWKPTERFSLGAVYNTKFTADVDYSIRRSVLASGFPAFRQKRSQEYTFPSALGLGVAYRFPNDKLTLSLDVTRREWDQFEIRDPDVNRLAYRSVRAAFARFGGSFSASAHRNRRTSGVTGLAMSLSDVDPTYTVRLGAEYVFVNAKKPKQDFLPSLRGGVFYDPEPSGSRKETWFGLGKTTGEPIDFFGFSVGAGLLVKDRVNVDAAYIYRFGDDARKDTFPLAGTDAEVDQHSFYLSTVIYF